MLAAFPTSATRVLWEGKDGNDAINTITQVLEALEEEGLVKSGKEAGHRHDMGGYELLQNIKSLAFSGCQKFCRTDDLRDVILTFPEIETS
jgi:hypothetical protein